MGARELLRRIRWVATIHGWPLKEVQGKGFHLKVWLNGRRTVIPLHSGDLPIGTFHQIKKDLDLTDAGLDV